MRLQKDLGPILQMDENKKWRRENIATLCFGTFKIKLEFGNTYSIKTDEKYL